MTPEESRADFDGRLISVPQLAAVFDLSESAVRRRYRQRDLDHILYLFGPRQRRGVVEARNAEMDAGRQLADVDLDLLRRALPEVAEQLTPSRAATRRCARRDWHKTAGVVLTTTQRDWAVLKNAEGDVLMVQALVGGAMVSHWRNGALTGRSELPPELGAATSIILGRLGAED